jgi:phenol 2-monooxygenase
MFLDSMKEEGLEVERPIVPIDLQMSDDPRELENPHAYPVKVWNFLIAAFIPQRSSS